MEKRRGEMRRENRRGEKRREKRREGGKERKEMREVKREKESMKREFTSPEEQTYFVICSKYPTGEFGKTGAFFS